MVEEGNYEALELDSQCDTLSHLLGRDKEPASSCEVFLTDYFKKYPPLDNPEPGGRYIRVNRKYVRLIMVPPDSFSLSVNYATQFDQMLGGDYSSGRLNLEYVQVRKVTSGYLYFRSFGTSIIDNNGQAGGMFIYSVGSNSFRSPSTNNRKFSIGVGGTSEGGIVELQYGSPTLKGGLGCEGLGGRGPLDNGTVCRGRLRFFF